MNMNAKDAQNESGASCAQTMHEPVLGDNAGQHHQASRAARRKAFEAEHGDWLTAQNARVEAHGIPGAELRPW